MSKPKQRYMMWHNNQYNQHERCSMPDYTLIGATLVEYEEYANGYSWSAVWLMTDRQRELAQIQLPPYAELVLESEEMQCRADQEYWRQKKMQDFLNNIPSTHMTKQEYLHKKKFFNSIKDSKDK